MLSKQRSETIHNTCLHVCQSFPKRSCILRFRPTGHFECRSRSRKFHSGTLLCRAVLSMHLEHEASTILFTFSVRRNLNRALLYTAFCMCNGLWSFPHLLSSLAIVVGFLCLSQRAAALQNVTFDSYYDPVTGCALSSNLVWPDHVKWNQLSNL